MRKTSMWAISLLLIVCVLFGCGISAFADDMSVSLEKVGEVSGDDFNYRSYTFRKAGILEQSEKDGYAAYTVLDPYGEVLIDKLYDGYSDLKDDYFVVYDAEAYPNYRGLVKNDGTILLPCEAVGIREVSGGDRYLEIVFATEEVENEEDAYLYLTDRMFSFGGPEDEDVLYDGYSKVYDLQEERYVEGIEITNPAESLAQVGDNIFLSSRKHELYNPDGELLSDDPGNLQNGYFYTRDSDTKEYSYYDGDLNLLYTLDFYPSRIIGDFDLLVINDQIEEDGDYFYWLADTDGERISDYYEHSISQYGDFLESYNDDDYYEIMDLEGNVLVPFSEEVTSTYELSFGFLSFRKGEDNYSLIYPDGKIVENISDSSFSFPIYRETDDGYEVFITDDADYSMSVYRVSTVNNLRGVIAVRSDEDSSSYALYSVKTGEQLLPEEYDRFETAGGYLYAKKGDDWEIYQIN